MSDTTLGSKVRLDFEYNFEKKEFILRFENRSQALAYQRRNVGARILEERPYDAWIPCADDMTGLRSSSVGMAVVFTTKKAAEKWRDRTILGTLGVFEKGAAHGVYFKREWSSLELEKELGSSMTNWKGSAWRDGSTNRPSDHPKVTPQLGSETYW